MRPFEIHCFMQLLMCLSSVGRQDCADRAQNSRPGLFSELFSGDSKGPAGREVLQGDVGCPRAYAVQLHECSINADIFW